eukprot:6019752-Prymnesium_polylepis.1
MLRIKTFGVNSECSRRGGPHPVRADIDAGVRLAPFDAGAPLAALPRRVRLATGSGTKPGLDEG